MDFVAVGAVIQGAVDGGVDGVNLGVLGMDVEDCLAAQSADDLDGVHALPNQMAGIQVGADFGANGLTQLFQGVGVVHAEALVHLQRDFVHAVGLGEGDKVLPIGDENFLPLPIHHLAKLVGPGADHPVGVLGLGAVAGAAGEAVNLMDAQLLRHEDGVVHIVVKLLGNLLVGMDGVAVAAQSADFQAGLLDGLYKLVELGLVVEQHAGVAVVLAGIAAAADFHHLGAQGLKIGKSLLQGGLADDIGENT